MLLRMNHILFQYNLKENTMGKEGKKKKSEFCFKSRVTKKLSPRICILSFKALWKSQDLGPEREAFILRMSQNSLSVQLFLVLGTSLLRSRELTEEILFA